MKLAYVGLTGLAVFGLASDAGAICREVEKKGTPSPVIIPEQPVLFVLRHDVPIGNECPGETDAGPPWAETDAGACEDRTGDAITMTVQPRFRTGAEGAEFALLMATPRTPIVTLADPDTFVNLAYATAPRVLIETTYVEDEALGYQCQDPKWNQSQGGCASGGGGTDWQPPTPPGVVPGWDAGTSDNVDVQLVGDYQVAVLGVDDRAAFAMWLNANDYAYDDADLDALQPYIDLGWTVVVVKIAADAEVEDGALAPLSFTYEGSEIRLPMGLSRQTGGGAAHISVFISADGRYDIPGAYVPFAQWIAGGSFLTRSNYWAELDQPASADPIAVRDASNQQTREEEIVEEIVRIPSSKCPGGRDDELDCGCGMSGGRGAAGTFGLAALCAAALWPRRRRR